MTVISTKVPMASLRRLEPMSADGRSSSEAGEFEIGVFGNFEMRQVKQVDQQRARHGAGNLRGNVGELGKVAAGDGEADRDRRIQVRVRCCRRQWT